jgi:hypothetical protein
MYSALPPYLGGKRPLVGSILGLLATVLPRAEWPRLHLLDPMSGGGAFALGAKAAGFAVTASDLALRAAIPASALIANSSRRLSTADVGLWLRDAAGAGASGSPVPPMFTAAQHQWFTSLLAAAAGRPEPLRSLLQLVVIKLVLRTQPMSVVNATDAPAAASGNYDRISAHRLGHYLKARELQRPSVVWSAAQQVNAGVFAGQGASLRGDATDVLVRTPTDVVYLDPPYPGTTAYGPSYAALDQLLGDDQVAAAAPPSLDALMEAAHHAAFVVVSLGGPRVSADELATAVGRHRPVLLARPIAYTHLRSLRKESARGSRFDESIVIAGR